ncbi:MAG: hypothetical protein KAW02_06985 [candidate division Zixibacteria bacterium]|nr:hypothetical protein [candidate division Zixibacteria bacterium]
MGTRRQVNVKIRKTTTTIEIVMLIGTECVLIQVVFDCKLIFLVRTKIDLTLLYEGKRTWFSISS